MVKGRGAIAWAFGMFAFALRALSLWQLSGSVLLETLIGDAINYDLWAAATGPAPTPRLD